MQCWARYDTWDDLWGEAVWWQRCVLWTEWL